MIIVSNCDDIKGRALLNLAPVSSYLNDVVWYWFIGKPLPSKVEKLPYLGHAIRTTDFCSAFYGRANICRRKLLSDISNLINTLLL